MHSFNTSLKTASCQHSNVHVKSNQTKQLNEFFYTCIHTAKLLACFKVCKLHIQTIIIIIHDYNVCYMLDIIIFLHQSKINYYTKCFGSYSATSISEKNNVKHNTNSHLGLYNKSVCYIQSANIWLVTYSLTYGLLHIV